MSRQLADPALLKLASEQRLVFQLSAESYSDLEDYYKCPKRTWRLSMILPASRFPMIDETNFGFWQWEDFKYFLIRNDGSPPRPLM